MIEIRKVHTHELGVIANFIAEMNRLEEQHIGYCGTEPEEIRASLSEDFDQVPYWESFVAAFKDGKVIGLIGFDGDLDHQTAEIWGPFVRGGLSELATELFVELKNHIPPTIEKLFLFPNKQNDTVISLAEEMDFEAMDAQVILTIDKESVPQQRETGIREVQSGQQQEFNKLHYQSFPDAYYSAEEILSRLDSQRKLFISTDGNLLTGYIYVEVEPAFNEASIEFVSVNRKDRGKGIGRKLIVNALQWMFTHDEIDSVTLCVNATNEKALKLYKKAGFKQVHELCFFKKSLVKSIVVNEKAATDTE
ncbi:GNAT family N-acetyltransferase [Thalassobacillus hwangdonensis]|uniref:GNAT family N-acetyltransferase n=1 Tax=Thalassobacillus hwangdonensis TaxID=546108 RepID=A0ABW3KWL0_9BACI